MDADNTDKLIARAIAALPYRSPSAGFYSRVMAGVAAEAPSRLWRERVFEAAGLMVAVWATALVFVSVRLVYINLADIAAFCIQPGGFTYVLNLLISGTALSLLKLTAVVSFAFELVSLAVSGLPAWRETAAAALLCSAAIASLSKNGRLSVQKSGV